MSYAFIQTTRKTTKTMMEWKPEGHEDTLTQSTLFKNRVFIACKKERSKVLQLVSGEIEMKDFISAEMTSRNGALLQELVEYLADSFVNLPEEYLNFLKNISKAYAVSSRVSLKKQKNILRLGDLTPTVFMYEESKTPISRL